MSAPYFTIFANGDEHRALLTPDDELILVREFHGERPPRCFGDRFPALLLFLDVCRNRNLLFNWRDSLLARPSPFDPWRPIRSPAEVNYILQSHLKLAAYRASDAPYDEISPGNLPENSSLTTRLRACGFLIYDTVQLDFCQQILAAVTDFPRVAGFLTHPVHGTPLEKWLAPTWSAP